MAWVTSAWFCENEMTRDGEQFDQWEGDLREAHDFVQYTIREKLLVMTFRGVITGFSQLLFSPSVLLVQKYSLNAEILPLLTRRLHL